MPTFILDEQPEPEPYSECLCPMNARKEDRHLCCECHKCKSPANVPCIHCWIEWISPKGLIRLAKENCCK